MSLAIVRLGSPRLSDEGLRIGTVRRPPRGVSKEDFARQDWYDVWLPELSPSAELVKTAQAASTDAEWAAFARHYRSEMKAPAAEHLLSLLAAMSHQTHIAVGCYCENEAHCHRSVLRELLVEHGAALRID
ncbi:DUF488 domain-containing protein [Uliginosibacterium sp. sgz301328]|uniref:DUF488 domain-containing protein n=1 Tax=Uliginosibacterium sp. sgz301328 TaxID=3243764 RepID=UPI00359D93B3